MLYCPEFIEAVGRCFQVIYKEYLQSTVFLDPQMLLII